MDTTPAPINPMPDAEVRPDASCEAGELGHSGGGEGSETRWARLHVHTGADRPGMARLPTTTRWLRAVVSRNPRRDKVPPLQLHVEDLGGACVHEGIHRATRVDLALPAGAYNVTAVVDGATHRYTLKLAPGKTLHLHLRPLA